MPSHDHVVSFPKGYPVRCTDYPLDDLPKSLLCRRGRIVSEIKTDGRQCWEVEFKGWKKPKPLYLGEFICIPDQEMVKYGNNIWIVSRPKSYMQYYFCPDNACRLFFEPNRFACSRECPMQDAQRKGVWCHYCGTMVVFEGSHSDFRRVDCSCGAAWFSTMSGVSQLVRNEK